MLQNRGFHSRSRPDPPGTLTKASAPRSRRSRLPPAAHCQLSRANRPAEEAYEGGERPRPARRRTVAQLALENGLKPIRAQRGGQTNRARTGQSSIPTLLISGSFDTLTSLAGAQDAAANLSNATIISIPGVDRFSQRKEQAALTLLLRVQRPTNIECKTCLGFLQSAPAGFERVGGFCWYDAHCG